MAETGPLAGRRLLLTGGLALALPRSGFGQAPAAAVPSSVAWPHTVSGRGGSATIYQPQVISWPGQTTLNARAAVAVTRQGGGTPILGTVEVTATTSTDFATRTVTLSDLRLVTSHFPSLDTNEAAQLETRIRAALPDYRLQGRAARHRPAEPQGQHQRAGRSGGEQRAAGDLLQRASRQPRGVRRRAGAGADRRLDAVARRQHQLGPVLRSRRRRRLVPAEQRQLVRRGQGHRSLAAHRGPAGGVAVPAGRAEPRRGAPCHPGPPRRAGGGPTIFVSTRPAEIIVTDGPPSFSPIPGTQVQIVTNGNSALFRHTDTGRFYYLVSGRWFSAAALEGPWSYATTELPPDFALIPPNSAAGSVLPSVPGTAQAQEAVLQAQIPARRRSTAARRRWRSPMSASRNSGRSPAPASPMR